MLVKKILPTQPSGDLKSPMAGYLRLLLPQKASVVRHFFVFNQPVNSTDLIIYPGFARQRDINGRFPFPRPYSLGFVSVIMPAEFITAFMGFGDVLFSISRCVFFSINIYLRDSRAHAELEQIRLKNS